MNNGFDGFPRRDNASKWGEDNFVNNTNFLSGVGISGVTNYNPNLVQQIAHVRNFAGFMAIWQGSGPSLVFNNNAGQLNGIPFFSIDWRGGNSTSVILGSSMPLSWSDSIGFSETTDVRINREVQGVLGQRNTQNSPQAYRLFSAWNPTAFSIATGSWLELGTATGLHYITSVSSNTGLIPLRLGVGITGTGLPSLVIQTGGQVDIYTTLNLSGQLNSPSGIFTSGVKSSSYLASDGNSGIDTSITYMKSAITSGVITVKNGLIVGVT